MEGVWNRTCLHRDHHAGIAAVLRIEAALQYAELRDGIDAGLGVLRLVVADVQVGRAIQVEVVLRAPSTEGEWNVDTSLKFTSKSLRALLVIPGTVLMRATQLRPFMGSSEICFGSTR